jgi:hypothetical protein
LRVASSLLKGDSMRYHMVHDLITGETRLEPMKATTDAEARAELQALIDDCPECQAARARGEVPQIVSVPRVPMRERFRRPRWRNLKRRVQR